MLETLPNGDREEPAVWSENDLPPKKGLRAVDWIILAVVTVALAYTLNFAYRGYQQSAVSQQRRNSLRLVDLLLNGYHAKASRFPALEQKSQEDQVSWRVNLLNYLHEESPQTLAQFGLESLPFPLHADSYRPEFYGIDTLRVFAVSSKAKGPNWRLNDEEARKSYRSFIIAIEYGVEGEEDFQWTDPVDLFFTDSEVYLGSKKRVYRRIDSMSDFHVLLANGVVTRIPGPLQGQELVDFFANAQTDDSY